MQAITIQLLNKEFSIKCPNEEIDELKEAANLLNSKMLEIKQKYNHLEHNQIIMLAALTISNNFNKAQSMQNDNFKKMSKVITALESKIKNTLDSEN